MKRRGRIAYWIAGLVWATAIACGILGAYGCSASQWAKTKAHTVEAGSAGLGGAAAVTIGGPLGFAVFVLLASVGVIVNEQLQPPDKVLVITLDAGGRVLKTERFQPIETHGAPKPGGGGLLSLFADFTWATLRGVLLFAALVVAYKAWRGPRYRECLKAAAGDLKRGRWRSAWQRLHEAGGMRHTDRPLPSPTDPA